MHSPYRSSNIRCLSSTMNQWLIGNRLEIYSAAIRVSIGDHAMIAPSCTLRQLKAMVPCLHGFSPCSLAQPMRASTPLPWSKHTMSKFRMQRSLRRTKIWSFSGCVRAQGRRRSLCQYIHLFGGPSWYRTLTLKVTTLYSMSWMVICSSVSSSLRLRVRTECSK